MKVGDIVHFQDNKGNTGNGIVNRIRSENYLDLKIVKRKGKYQLFLNVPKKTDMSTNQNIAFWTPYIPINEKREESFKKKLDQK